MVLDGHDMATRKHTRKRNVLKARATPMLSVRLISQRYGFHPHTVRAWVNRDGLKAVKHGPGGKMFIRQDDVEEFIKGWYELDE